MTDPPFARHPPRHAPGRQPHATGERGRSATGARTQPVQFMLLLQRAARDAAAGRHRIRPNGSDRSGLGHARVKPECLCRGPAHAIIDKHGAFSLGFSRRNAACSRASTVRPTAPYAHSTGACRSSWRRSIRDKRPGSRRARRTPPSGTGYSSGQIAYCSS